jgi:hypothetical protein
VYILSLYFQDPAGLGLNALEAGLATLPAAAGMIAITPAITPLAVKIGGGRAVALAVGLGIANGPASSGSTSAVPADQVGAASGISNMARYVGAAVAVAAIAMVNDAVINDRRADGHSAAEALAGGLAASAAVMAVWSGLGVGLIVLMARQRIARPRAIDRVAAADAASHTVPTGEVRVR